jgi:hypothetical protein
MEGPKETMTYAKIHTIWNSLHTVSSIKDLSLLKKEKKTFIPFQSL